MTDKNLGAKFDADKPMYNLLPANAIDSLAKVLTFGANKYAPNSWQRVPDGLERYRAALLRHTFAIQRGEYLDHESGLPHSAHAMCCCAFINELEGRDAEKCDTPKQQSKPIQFLDCGSHEKINQPVFNADDFSITINSK